MNARTRPMTIDGHSIEAGAVQTAERISPVQVVVLDILRTAGPLADDDIFARFQLRVEAFGDVPHASPQSVRSRRAELVRRGPARATNRHGVSRFGSAATVWALALPDAA